MPKHRFGLYNAMHGETVALVELDDELLQPEAKIVDPETMTLRPIRNGGIYTLLPLDDHTISVLQNVRRAYQGLTETPAKLLSDYMSRLDGLVDAVRLLFNKVEYIVVESADDISNLINPPKGEYQPKTVSYDALGALQALLDQPQDAHQDPPE